MEKKPVSFNIIHNLLNEAKVISVTKLLKLMSKLEVFLWVTVNMNRRNILLAIKLV